MTIRAWHPLFALGLVACTTSPSGPTRSTPALQTGSDQGGVVRTVGLSLRLMPPQGWLMDTQAGRAQGLLVVFYPEYSDWENAEVVMQVRVESGGSASGLIRADSRRYRARSKVSVISEAEDQRTGQGTVIEVRIFSFEANALHEAVAYISEPGAVVRIALRARDRETFEYALGAFERLLGSYQTVE